MRIVLALSLWIGCISAVWPCAPAYRRGEVMQVVSETALIVYDPKAKMQHFVRQAQFQTNSLSFGFLVPTPSRPLLADVDERLFAQLSRFTEPETITETRWVDHSLWEWFKERAAQPLRGEIGDASAPPERPAVQVIDRVSVGGMEATILRATDAEKLRDWLNQHGFEARPALTEWLKVYVDQGWYLTAFQYKKSDASAGGYRAQPIRISCATDKPFYPYREPADSRSTDKKVSRQLRLFFASTEHYHGALGSRSTWSGQTVWSAPLSAEQTERLGELLSDPRAENEQSPLAVRLPETVWLTEYVDSSSPRPGFEEVFFQKSGFNEIVKRPPHIVYQTLHRIDPREIATVWIVGIVLLMGIGLFLIYRYCMVPGR
jgi:hypothetical protein